MQQIHLMMFTGQANMKFPFLKQKLQRSWSSSSSSNMMTQKTLKTNLQLQYAFCWEICLLWTLDFLSESLSYILNIHLEAHGICLLWKQYSCCPTGLKRVKIKNCMEASCRKEQLQHSKKLRSRQTQGWCNQITCPYVDDLFSHQLRFCSLFLSLSTESTIFFSSWVAPSRNFGTDFLIFSLQQQHRNSLLTWCYSDFFQQIKLLMFKQTSQEKRGQQKWEWYTKSLRLGEKSVSCTKLACKTVRICR